MAAAPDLRSRVRRNLPLLTGFVFLLGLRLYIPVWLTYYRQLGLDSTRAASLWAINFAVVLACDGLTGVVADRWGYRRSLMLGSVILTVSFLGIYAAPATPDIWWCLVSSHILLGVGAPLVYTSTTQAFGSKSAAWLGENGAYVKFASRSFTSLFAASALGAVLAWSVIGLWWQTGPRLIWVVQAALSASLAAVAYWTWDLPGFRPQRQPGSVHRKLAATLRSFPAWRQVATTMLPLITLLVMCELTVYVVQEYCVSTGLGVNWATLLTAGGFGVTALTVSRSSQWLERYGVWRITVVCTATLAAAYLGLALLPGRWAMLAIALLFVPDGPPIIAAMQLLDQMVPQYKATALSVFTSAKTAGYIITWPALGWLIDHLSFRTACLSWAIGFSGCFLALAAALQRKPKAQPTLSTEPPSP